MKPNFSVALVGNPNVGKTSIFNRLTNSFEHVGNYPGVTVSEKTKIVKMDDKIIQFTDLPGLYSLSALSKDEEVARDNVVDGAYDVILCVVEASQLQRNLYLTLQLLECSKRVVLVVNMMDELHKSGRKLDCKKLSEILGIEVVSTSATTRAGVSDLVNLIKTQKIFNLPKNNLPYIQSLPIDNVKKIIEKKAKYLGLDEKYLSIKIMENDTYTINRLELSNQERNSMLCYTCFADEIAKKRYDYIEYIVNIVLSSNGKISIRSRALNLIDKIVLNKYLALPLFFSVMLGIFYITFGMIGQSLSQIASLFFERIVIANTETLLRNISASDWVISLVCDGVIKGLSSVLVFLPQIVLLFFFLAILEDSGYVSRLAFMTDGFFGKVGLSGRAFFTLLMGFGCSASAVLTSRGIDDEVMRKKTAIITPFMSCTARLPVYTAILGAFIPKYKVIVCFALYLLGVVVALGLAYVFEKLGGRLRSGQSSLFIEIPPYRLPSFERIIQLLIHNIKTFVVRVGTIIFVLNLVVWILSHISLTAGFVLDGKGSIMFTFANIFAPIFYPLGFGNWKAVTALLSGLVAKESVISTLGTLGGAGVVAEGGYPIASSIAFCVFTLLYIPCIATIGALLKEVGVKWTVFGVILQLLCAYAFALLIRLIMIVASLSIGVVVSAIIVSLMIIISIIMLRKIIKNKKLDCINCSICKKNCAKKE